MDAGTWMLVIPHSLDEGRLDFALAFDCHSKALNVAQMSSPSNLSCQVTLPSENLERMWALTQLCLIGPRGMSAVSFYPF